MSNLNGELALRKVTLPGTHDAGTYDIHLFSPMNPHRHDKALKWIKISKYTLPWIAKNYSKTQNVNLVEQFKLGIRVFDLRVAKYRGEYRFTHGMLGGVVLNDITDLIKYSQQHSKEIIILYFKFIFGFTDEDHKIFQTRLNSVIGNRLADYQHYKPDTKLVKYWSKKKNIIVVYNDPAKDGRYWNRRIMGSKWLNKTKAEDAMEYIQPYLDNGGKSYKNRLWGIDAALTPDGKYIATNFWSSTIKMAKTLNKRMVEELKNAKTTRNISYIFFDVAEYPELARVIIDSNFVESTKR